MTALDILIIAVAGVSLVMGFCKGIVAQAGSIVAVVAGIASARMFGHSLAMMFGGAQAPGAVDYICAYAVTFIAAYLIAWLVFRMIRSTVHGAKLGIIDRVAGAVFKAAEWLLLLSLALNLYLMISGDEAEICRPSKPWRGAVVEFAPALLGYLTSIDNINDCKDVTSEAKASD